MRITLQRGGLAKVSTPVSARLRFTARISSNRFSSSGTKSPEIPARTAAGKESATAGSSRKFASTDDPENKS